MCSLATHSLSNPLEQLAVPPIASVDGKPKKVVLEPGSVPVAGLDDVLLAGAGMNKGASTQRL